jgi:hypothetical protein
VDRIGDLAARAADAVGIDAPASPDAEATAGELGGTVISVTETATGAAESVAGAVTETESGAGGASAGSCPG